MWLKVALIPFDVKYYPKPLTLWQSNQVNSLNKNKKKTSKILQWLLKNSEHIKPCIVHVLVVFNTPGVAGSVLHTHLSFINSFNCFFHPFPPNIKHINTPKPLWNNVHQPLCVTWHMSYFVSYVSCHMSPVL